MIGGIVVDRLVDAAVDGAVGLLVAGEAHRIDGDRIGHRQLADGAWFVIAEGARLARQDSRISAFMAMIAPGPAAEMAIVRPARAPGQRVAAMPADHGTRDSHRGAGNRHRRKTEAEPDHPAPDRRADRIAKVERADVDRRGEVGRVGRRLHHAHLERRDDGEGRDTPQEDRDRRRDGRVHRRREQQQHRREPGERDDQRAVDRTVGEDAAEPVAGGQAEAVDHQHRGDEQGPAPVASVRIGAI